MGGLPQNSDTASPEDETVQVLFVRGPKLLELDVPSEVVLVLLDADRYKAVFEAAVGEYSQWHSWNVEIVDLALVRVRYHVAFLDLGAMAFHGSRLGDLLGVCVSLFGGDVEDVCSGNVGGGIGGIWSNLAYGGQYMGRGIRARRYIGRIKLVGQTELRAMLYGRPDKLSILTFAFLDAGYVGVSYRHFGGDRAQLLLGFGGGVGIYWGRSFVLRFDVATSALEDYAPYYYLTLTHPY